MKMKHITIQSAEFEKSVKFYEDIAGLTICGDMRGKGAMNIVFLADDNGGTCVEIIESPEQAYSGTGISIGFEVEDAEAYREQLSEKGLDPTPMITPFPGTSFFFVNDPDGVQVQFICEK